MDLSRLPNPPWTVLPDPTSKSPNAVIYDACNEFVAEIKAKSRTDMLEIAKLIEDVTRGER